MYKILFTGGTGFIGSNILKYIQLNHKVYVIQKNESKKVILKSKNIQIIKFNNYNYLSSKLKKIKVDAVIHCATHYKKIHTTSDLKKFAESNILLGNIILENIKNMGAKKFINFTTTWGSSEGILNNPKNLYAAYKTEIYQTENKHVYLVEKHKAYLSTQRECMKTRRCRVWPY